MAQIIHDVSTPNSGDGDPLRTGFVNQNSMNTELYDTKVDKVTGMGLSSNDYKTDEKIKLAGIEAGAQVNVPADWLTILNPPDLNSIAAFPDTRFGYIDSNSFELPDNVQALSVRKNGEPTDVNINNWTQTANVVTYIGTLVSGDYLIISGVYVILSNADSGGSTPTNYPAKTMLANPLEFTAPPTFLEIYQVQDFLEISDLLVNNSGNNSGDETTQTIQNKRPLKTVNGESLEGTGNITISGGGGGGGAVDSVNGQVGEVVLNAADVGALSLNGGTITGNLVVSDTIDCSLIQADIFMRPNASPDEYLMADGSVSTIDLSLKADLVDGLVPQSQLPASVSDILEFANLASFPLVGEAGKIYIAISPSNFQYRWTGLDYVAITNGLIASTNDVPEGSNNLYFTTARVLATVIGTLTNAAGAVRPTDTILNAISRLQNTLAELLGRTTGTNTGDNAPNTNSNAYADTLVGTLLRPQIEVSSNQTAVTGWNGKEITFITNGILTIQDTLPEQFNFALRADNSTITWAIASPFTWRVDGLTVGTAPRSMVNGEIAYVSRRLNTNEIRVSGL